MDDEHGAFWVSVVTDDKNVIETNKDLSRSIILQGQETKYQALEWTEVEEFYNLLLLEKFDEIVKKITNADTMRCCCAALYEVLPLAVLYTNAVL